MTAVVTDPDREHAAGKKRSCAASTVGPAPGQSKPELKRLLDARKRTKTTRSMVRANQSDDLTWQAPPVSECEVIPSVVGDIAASGALPPKITPSLSPGVTAVVGTFGQARQYNFPTTVDRPDGLPKADPVSVNIDLVSDSSVLDPSIQLALQQASTSVVRPAPGSLRVHDSVAAPVH